MRAGGDDIYDDWSDVPSGGDDLMTTVGRAHRPALILYTSTLAFVLSDSNDGIADTRAAYHPMVAMEPSTPGLPSSGDGEAIDAGLV